jgi:hypothetical protein
LDREPAPIPELHLRSEHGEWRPHLITDMVGALVRARAVDDPGLSDALRKAALKHLALTQD